MGRQKMIELLKTDVPAWNQWRADNPDAVIDLSGANLSGLDLRNADLFDVNLFEVNLSVAKLNRAILDWAYHCGAKLTGANLMYVTLNSAYQYHSDLTRAYHYHANCARAFFAGDNTNTEAK
jgi:uncharacterized protein YjbI with pentapeptide repeats